MGSHWGRHIFHWGAAPCPLPPVEPPLSCKQNISKLWTYFNEIFEEVWRGPRTNWLVANWRSGFFRGSWITFQDSNPGKWSRITKESVTISRRDVNCCNLQCTSASYERILMKFLEGWDWECLKDLSIRTGWSNWWPAGRIRPVRLFNPAREWSWNYHSFCDILYDVHLSSRCLRSECSNRKRKR